MYKHHIVPPTVAGWVCKNKFLEYAREHRIQVQAIDEKAVEITTKTSNIQELKLVLEFALMEYVAQVRTMVLTTFSPEMRREGLTWCNVNNEEYRWVRFRMNFERQIIGLCEFLVPVEAIGATCMSYIEKIEWVVNEVYPDLIKLSTIPNNE